MAKTVQNTQLHVAQTSDDEIDRRLRREMEARVAYFAQHPDQIDTRLRELDREWDIERVFQTNAAGISLFAILMARRRRRWLVLPLAAAGFLMQHAVQGWCPPMEILRRLGVRTTQEINDERVTLKILRGDFDGIDMSKTKLPQDKTERALQAIEND